jgi:hypothetical protein
LNTEKHTAKFHHDGFDQGDLNVKVSELLVATADSSDELIDRAVTEVLGLLRERLSMDVVFVSEFVNGQRVFRYVDARPGNRVLAAGACDPLEVSWCQRVVDGRLPQLIPKVNDLPSAVKADLPRLPFDIGTHLSTPILLNDGRIYGTLCCFSFGINESVQERDLKNLKWVAMLVARKLCVKQPMQQAPEPASLSLQPVAKPGW